MVACRLVLALHLHQLLVEGVALELQGVGEGVAASLFEVNLLILMNLGGYIVVVLRFL